MLWVYAHYKYVYSYCAGIDFSLQNLTSTPESDVCRRQILVSVDVRFWRLYLGHIHFGDSVAHAFRRFLRQLLPDFLEI